MNKKKRRTIPYLEVKATIFKMRVGHGSVMKHRVRIITICVVVAL